MPEGPEIKRVADELASVLVDEKVAKVTFAFAHLKPYEQKLMGRMVRQVRPRGKALLTEFVGGLTIYSHNQLYGRWVVAENGAVPDTGRQLRLALHTRVHSCLLYSASDIEVLDAAGIAVHPFLNKLGPDVLETAIEDIEGRYRDASFQGRQLGALLLDQSFLAGLGNYLRSEILFVARVFPLTRLRDIGEEQRVSLAQLTRSLTRQSYETEGVTNDLKSYELLRRAGRSFAESRYWVFDREAAPCYECGTEIVKISVNSSRLYYCPCCQPE